MNPKTLIGLFALLIITCNSCKDKFKTGPEEYVPAYIKAMVPYTNGQTLSFSNGSGQIITATVSVTSKFTYSGVCSNCSSTPNPEIITYTLNAGANKFMEFIVDPQPYVRFTIYSPLQNYQFANNFNFLVEPGVAQLSCVAGGQVCLPSITLNGKTFINVVEISGTGQDRAYHTASQGIVGFKYANGTIYTLN